MYLLYVDESGGSEHENLVLGGVAAFEGDLRGLTEGVEALLEKYFPGNGINTRLHMRELRGLAWSSEEPSFGKAEFFSLADDLCELVASEADRHKMVLFGNVIHRPSLAPAQDAYSLAFEGVTKRFDSFLVREHKRGNTQKGIMIIERSTDFRIKQLREIFSEFRTEGTRWGRIYNLPEIPLFARKDDTRLVQLADFVAYATFRRYEYSQGRDFDRILHGFDADNGVIHGLGHLAPSGRPCPCQTCVTRRVQIPHVEGEKEEDTLAGSVASTNPKGQQED
jgi:hypothetical protein